MYNNLLLVFAIQVLTEFLPISSTLFLNTLGMEEGVIFHVFSGMMFTVVYFPHIWNVIRYPFKHKYIIQVYFWAILPSAIMGYLTSITNTLFVVKSLNVSVVCNIITGIILFLVSFYRRKEPEIFDSANSEKYQLSLMDGFIVGVLTSLNGVIPGLSRLGMGLTYLVFRRKNIPYAGQVLFVTGIPISIGKPIVHFIKHPSSWHLFVNFIFTQHIYAFLVAFLAIVIFDRIKNLISSRSLMYIALIRIVYYSGFLLYRFLV